MRVVFLFEGTENEPVRNPSAISRLRSMLVNDASMGQMVWLSKGSGTHGCCCVRFFGSLLGLDSFWIVYRQLLRLYKTVRGLQRGQRANLFIFGFSRGAYQARLFARLVTIFYPKVPIRYLGLIDTVRAGLPIKIGWLYAIPRRVGRCRHAIAIHEYRIKFTPKRVVCGRKRADIEERYFLGCHSDVGWAYNGQRSERACIAWLKCRCCQRTINRAKTGLYGKIALSWLLNPVEHRLDFRADEHTQKVLAFETTPRSINDYINLCVYAPFLVHDPMRELSNLWGIIPPRVRTICFSEQFSPEHLHYTADAVRLVFRQPFMMRNLQYASLVADTIVFKQCLLKILGFSLVERLRIRKCINNYLINFLRTLISEGIPFV